MNNEKPSLAAIIGALLLLMFGSLAYAEVRDNAGLFSEQAVRQANERISKLGVPVVVETYAALPDAMIGNYNPQRKDESFAAFSKQRVQQVAPNGVYMLVTTNPNYVSVTEGTKNVIRGADTNAARNAMVHSFGAKRFDEGLLRGIDAVSYSTGLQTTAAPQSGAVERSPDAQPSSPQPSPRADGRSGGISLWQIILWGVILFIAFRLIRRMFARRDAQHHPAGGLDPRQRHPGAYDQPSQGRAGGFGGFGTGLGGGLLGGILGGMLGGSMARRGDASTTDPNAAAPQQGGVFGSDQDREFASSGGTFGDDAGGGADVGGGDAGGGGDSSGGEF